MFAENDCRPISERDIPATAALLAGTLHDDPAYAFLFPDADTRARGLTDFFSRNLATHLPYGCTHVLLEGGDVVGTVTVRRSDAVDLSLLAIIRRGLLPFGRQHGASAVKRLLLLKNTYDALETQSASGHPHFLVHMMAVAPSRQGRGLGSRLLSSVLSHARRGPGAPGTTVLTTHKEENVAFYRRHGFFVSDFQEVAPARTCPPFPVWGMRREA